VRRHLILVVGHMAEISENQLRKLENEASDLISEKPEAYERQVRQVAMKILLSNISMLEPRLTNELPAISQLEQSQSPSDAVSAMAEKLWGMIDGVYMNINDPKVAAVRAAICAMPYPDPQDPQMALEYLVIFSKAAGFSNESIFQAIASTFSMPTET